MQKPADDIDLLLPFGEALRGFLEQPFISPSDYDPGAGVLSLVSARV